MLFLFIYLGLSCWCCDKICTFSPPKVLFVQQIGYVQLLGHKWP